MSPGPTLSGDDAAILAPRGAQLDALHFEELAHRRLPVFGELQIEFLDEVGRQLRQPTLRDEEGLMAAGFWMRRRHLESMRQHVEPAAQQRVAPRGLVLHVAPSNADPMFVYSWALSVLAGNPNIVRVSTRGGSAQQALLETVSNVMEMARFQPIRQTNLLGTWSRDSALTAEISARADARVLWGSDQSVAALRSLPLPPYALDIAFADRIGLCALSARLVAEADAGQLSDVVSRFVRDAWTFDQMACASPHHVVWIGADTVCERAAHRFWAAVEEEVDARSMSPALASARRQHLYELAASEVELALVHRSAGGGPVVLRSGPNGVSELRSGGGGFFVEVFVRQLQEIVPWCRRRHQTLTHAGVGQAVLEDLVSSLAGRSIDRVVPLGQALEFEPVWDGISLLSSLVRRITLRCR